MPTDEPTPAAPSPIEIPKSAESNPHLDELESELSTLAELQRLWLPSAVPQSSELADDKDEDSETAAARNLAEAALKALDRVIKLSQRRTKLLGLEPNKRPRGCYQRVTLEEFEQTFENHAPSKQP